MKKRIIDIFETMLLIATAVPLILGGVNLRRAVKKRIYHGRLANKTEKDGKILFCIAKIIRW